MMSTIQTALLYTLIPLLAATLAGATAAYKPPRARATSAVQHFAAGVIFAAAAIELLPELLKHSPAPTLIGFALGIAAMFALRDVTEQVERTGRGDRASLPRPGRTSS
jgi:ZIP family zinc transporter